MSPAVSDRIEKQVVLRAPLSRVWQALTDSTEFGQWFGVRFDGPFKAGEPISGRITPTTMDAKVAEMQKPYDGVAFNITIDRIEPRTVFSFRWHPFAIDPKADYSSEPTTLVSFVLKEVPEGVQLTVTESGFDQVPLDRRATAFTANEGGWSMQVTLIKRYVEKPVSP
ncbi:MAG TPA: SRPBCC family protein [Vicinamibacterales bacterium]|nr:SRPBCC family protein [Vicinamibacterales bacterium]